MPNREQRLNPVLAALSTVQKSLALSIAEGDPIDAPTGTCTGWSLVMPEDVHPECPAWMNTWEMIGETRQGFREHVYDVRMQLFIENADLEVAADIATAYWAKLMLALDGGQSLGGTCNHTVLASGKLAKNSWGGRPYPGLDCHLTVYCKDIVTFNP